MTGPSLSDTFKNALALHRHGQLREAEKLYRAIVDHDPGHFDAHSLLGVIASQRQDYAAAACLFNHAATLNPSSALAHASAGNALAALRRHADAVTSFRRSLALEPNHPAVLNNLGNALFELARFDEALACYSRSLDIQSGCAEVLFNRGNACLELGRPAEALADYERALTSKAVYPDALNKRGAALRELKRLDESLASYDSALALRADYAEALNDRGNTLLELGRAEQALASYDRALTARPGFAEAIYNKGTALSALSRHGESSQEFSRLLALRPDFGYARGELFYSRLHCCDWTDYSRAIAQIMEEVAAGKKAAAPFVFLSVSGLPSIQLKCAKIYSEDKARNSSGRPQPRRSHRHGRIRVAYLSADFHDHATAYLTAQLFELHDRTRFETYAISFDTERRGDMRRRLESAFSHFIDVQARNDHDVAVLLRDLEIDIAVDLKGHTQYSRPGIFAARAAPVQVNYLGYPGTTGAAFMDYIIADRVTIPDGQRRFYAEKVVRVPDSYQPTDSQRQVSEWTPARGEVGLPESGFVFCSFVAHYKIVPAVFDCWMRLLAGIDDGVLWLLAGSERAAGNLRRRAEAHGIAAERLVFAPRMKLEHHLARQRLADLFLDTLPINAHTTANDALWAGVPLLTCLGAGFAGRVAASVLHAAGLPELIAETPEAYEGMALGLARDRDRLAELRAKLARNRNTCPLFDTDRLRRHLESAFATMHSRHQQGQRPIGFDIEDTVPVDFMNELAALTKTGRAVDLEHRCRDLLNRYPTSGVIWQMLGISLARQGKDALEAAERAAYLLPEDAGALINLGNALGRQGRLKEAVHALSRGLILNPQYAEAHETLGNTLLELGRFADAAASYRRALDIAPRVAATHHNLGSALRSLGMLDDAVACFRQAIALEPGLGEAHCNLGVALRLQGRTDAAQTACRMALGIDPRSTAAWMALAETHADQGQFTEAERLLQHVVSIAPDSAEAWAGIVRLRKMTFLDREWLVRARRIADGPLPFKHKVVLRYAMGKYFDDLGEFAQAFENFQCANELTKLHRDRHDRRRLTQIVDGILQSFDPEWLYAARAGSDPSPRPVFIVGMLRSGTTLAEQILASHPGVFGAGELTYWSAATPLNSASTSVGAPCRGILPSPEALSGLARDYLQQLHILSGEALRVVDKMPTNFAFLGLIHAALPNARIIHMQRHPLDNCLSIYCQQFESGVSYANDLPDLAHYYAEYRRLMKHWQSILPADTILNVPYEALVADQETWSRAMLEFIGLPWDAACLDFHNTQRSVVTASKWQVRQKINAASVGRWRRYEDFLKPLRSLVE